MATRTNSAKQRRVSFDDTAARNLGTNVFRYRMQIVPYQSRERLADATKGAVSEETLRKIEDSRDPSKPAHWPELKKVEHLAMGLRRLGVDVTAIDLFNTPSKPTGQVRHLWSVPKVGDDLPRV
jgi:hypothetical protein